MYETVVQKGKSRIQIASFFMLSIKAGYTQFYANKRVFLCLFLKTIL